MGPTAGVQHPHRPMILEASAVDVATDHPAKAMALGPGGRIPVAAPLAAPTAPPPWGWASPGVGSSASA